MRHRLVRLTVLMAVALAAATLRLPREAPAMEHQNLPIVIGHRGACGLLPEHTLASYELAIAQGADFVEPDLVATKDGVLVARHENAIGDTTDVAAKFPQRKRQKTIDGQAVEDYFTEDFTLAELKTLRARQRLAFRDHGHDDRDAVPTFEEILDLVRRKQRETGRTIGVYPETKHPSYFRSIGLPLEGRLVELLDRYGYDKPDSPVFIQSFEVQNLKDLRRLTKVPLIVLLGEPGERPYDFVVAGDPRTYADLTRPEALAAIATFAQGIGPWKRLVVPLGPDGRLGPATSLVADAHKAGLLVHAYTFRDEPRYLTAEDGDDPAREYARFFALGLDGVFTDFPGTAVAARTAWASAAGRQ